MSLPVAARPFIEFPSILRAHGFAIAPDQTISFIEAVGLLGPQEMIDIHRAGLAMFAIPKDRQAEYDALFRAYFIGQTVSAPTEVDDEDDSVEAFEQSSGQQEVVVEEDDNEAGVETSVSESLSHKTFPDLDEDESLKQFSRLAQKQLPRKTSRRRLSSRKGDAFDLKKSLRQATRRDGEVFDLYHTKKKTKQRAIVLLIDVSGSMKDQSEATMRFAHTLMQVGEAVEVFTFGTRLTRITPALNVKNTEQAMESISGLIADFDGGTRIGEALSALLSVPRFAVTMRGAAVQILSDGLERESPDEMLAAVRRISQIAWRVDWLTPLATGPNYVPKTEALSAVLPYLTSLADGGSIQSICEHVLSIANPKIRRAA